MSEVNGMQLIEATMPLVSIVIPAYNHASYLRESIESVLSQDYPNIELIVIDDGSTDETAEVLKEYGAKFYWETQQNSGQASTLNKGWSMARGEILAYLSADDILLSDAVGISVRHLIKYPAAALVYCDFQLIDPESKVIRNVSAPDYSYQEMVTKFICAPGPGAFFRRRVFEQAGGWDTQFRQSPDYEYWLRLGLFGEFEHIKERLAGFRVHDGSQSFAQTTVERAEEPLRIMEKYFGLESLPAHILIMKSEVYANAHFMVMQLHLRSGRYFEACKHVFQACALSPSSVFSYRVWRMFANGLVNRFLHRCLWTFRKITDSVFRV